MSPRGGVSVPETPLQENFTGNPLGAPKSQVEKGVVFFFPFHSKAFLHMTQTSLNFAKLQSWPVVQPQSGGENVKKGKKKFVSQLNIVLLLLKGIELTCYVTVSVPL